MMVRTVKQELEWQNWTTHLTRNIGSQVEKSHPVSAVTKFIQESQGTLLHCFGNMEKHTHHLS